MSHLCFCITPKRKNNRQNGDSKMSLYQKSETWNKSQKMSHARIIQNINFPKSIDFNSDTINSSYYSTLIKETRKLRQKQ